MTWKVHHQRPEDRYRPGEYFQPSSYESSGMRRAQERLTRRALELLGLGKGKKVLDAGCGTGYSMRIIKEAGHQVIGVDLNPEMVRKAREKGFQAVEGKLEDLPFPSQEFDAVISISTLQWVKNRRRAAREFYRVLKPGGKAVVQFYPSSEKEALRTGKLFSSRGMGVKLAIDHPDNPKKRKVFLVMRKRLVKA